MEAGTWADGARPRNVALQQRGRCCARSRPLGRQPHGRPRAHDERRFAPRTPPCARSPRRGPVTPGSPAPPQRMFALADARLLPIRSGTPLSARSAGWARSEDEPVARPWHCLGPPPADRIAIEAGADAGGASLAATVVVVMGRAERCVSGCRRAASGVPGADRTAAAAWAPGDALMWRPSASAARRGRHRRPGRAR